VQAGVRIKMKMEIRIRTEIEIRKRIALPNPNDPFSPRPDQRSAFGELNRKGAKDAKKNAEWKKKWCVMSRRRHLGEGWSATSYRRRMLIGLSLADEGLGLARYAGARFASRSD
jgi:hypothetical protein